MKKVIYLGFFMIIAGLCLNYQEELIILYQETVKYFTPERVTVTKNEYYREQDFSFVQNTVDFEPENAQDILNIFYTVINSGMSSFTFYCPSQYTNCTEDIKELANDQTKLSHINNFVHPYNAFKHIETQYSSLGEVTISIKKTYTDEDISSINTKVEEIYSRVVNESSTDIDKIRGIHDYIINNSKYDSNRSDNNIINYKSDIAYGPLLEGWGICGGYSDAMQLFLEKFGIKNYKISSESHVWNAVYLDGKWYHLDLTWDDPITTNNIDILQHDYFIINSGQLFEKDQEEHIFDQDIYLELKQA